MEEEKSLRDSLQDVPEKVGAAHVGEFMGEDDFEFVGAERRNGAERKEDNGAKCAHGHGTVDRGRESKRDGTVKTEQLADTLEACADSGGSFHRGREAQATKMPPATEAAQRESEDTGEPETVDPGQEIRGGEMASLRLQREHAGCGGMREVACQRCG